MGMISIPVVAKVYRLGEQFDNIREEKSLLIDAVVLFLYLPEFYSITVLFFFFPAPNRSISDFSILQVFLCMASRLYKIKIKCMKDQPVECVMFWAPATEP